MTFSRLHIDIYCVITKLIAKDFPETNGVYFGFAHPTGIATAILHTPAAV